MADAPSNCIIRFLLDGLVRPKSADPTPVANGRHLRAGLAAAGGRRQKSAVVGSRAVRPDGSPADRRPARPRPISLRPPSNLGRSVAWKVRLNWTAVTLAERGRRHAPTH